ncbi:hypothetical protein GPECTOR_5g106 [Gonium pectorale]|uniref:Uncharacterized protein n=1 Tax=Gonium pectorale TaxID=33097 RepID=A0A150GW15_GONPE|nr:hypothetical protein GPECTOR_5g106 [Gonium pectorale]|eukprot:KXZ53994.1 hypothetical protein GPECTOR_5g106 [Gonium pectorale]
MTTGWRRKDYEGPNVFISEFHYLDSSGSAVQQLEIVMPTMYSESSLSVVTYSFYNFGGQVYDSLSLSAPDGESRRVSSNTVPGNPAWRVVTYNLSPMLPAYGPGEGVGGIALVASCADGTRTVLDFIAFGLATSEDISYVAVEGLAAGSAATLIGRTEDSSTATDASIKREGSGTTGSYAGWTWTSGQPSSWGAVDSGSMPLSEPPNEGLCGGPAPPASPLPPSPEPAGIEYPSPSPIPSPEPPPPACTACPSVFISEFHYLDDSEGATQRLEIVFPTTFDYTSLTVVTYSYTFDTVGGFVWDSLDLSSLAAGARPFTVSTLNAFWKAITITVTPMLPNHKPDEGMGAIALAARCHGTVSSWDVVDFVAYGISGRDLYLRAQEGLAEGPNVFISEFHYADNSTNEGRVEVIMPTMFNASSLVMIPYAFYASGSTSWGHFNLGVAYSLNNRVTSSVLRNNPSWRVMTVYAETNPYNIALIPGYGEGRYGGIALLILCPDGTYTVVDFVAYGPYIGPEPAPSLTPTDDFAAGPNVFISEFHYLDEGASTQLIELVLPVSFDETTLVVVSYTFSSDEIRTWNYLYMSAAGSYGYNVTTFPLASNPTWRVLTIKPPEGTSFLPTFGPGEGLGGLALIQLCAGDSGMVVLDFIAFGVVDVIRSLTPLSGFGAGSTATYIGVYESKATSINTSIQRSGSGITAIGTWTWTGGQPSTWGAVDSGSMPLSGMPDEGLCVAGWMVPPPPQPPSPAPPPPPTPAATCTPCPNVFISEFHYMDVSGWGAVQQIEVVMPSAFDVSSLRIVTYGFYPTMTVSWVNISLATAAAAGRSVISSVLGWNPAWRAVAVTMNPNMPVTQYMETGLGGIALVQYCPDGSYSVLELIAYGPYNAASASPPSLLVTAGLAIGRYATAINAYEDTSTPTNTSIQRSGPNVFISEFHYVDGAASQQRLEIILPAMLSESVLALASYVFTPSGAVSLGQLYLRNATAKGFIVTSNLVNGNVAWRVLTISAPNTTLLPGFTPQLGYGGLALAVLCAEDSPVVLEFIAYGTYTGDSIVSSLMATDGLASGDLGVHGV